MNKLTTKQFLRNFNVTYARNSIKKTSFESFLEKLHDYYKTIRQELIDNPNVHEDRLQSITSHFMAESLYKKYDVNPYGRQDLAIKVGDTVNVIMEFKAPKNKSEMINVSDINRKALHEALHYYFGERLKGNFEIKNIIITNCLEWFFFDASEFEKLFKNKKLQDTYSKWQSGFTSVNDTKAIYDVFKTYITNNTPQFNFAYIDLQILLKSFNNKPFSEIITSLDKNQKKPEILNLYKILSPECLLREYNPKDSNELNKGFYDELLYIIGLEEKEIDNKKKIVVSGVEGSLIQETISVLQVDKNVYKKDLAEEVAIELALTWMNRILFLKLFEGQLIAFNDKNKDFEFITSQKIKDFDSLNSLFFRVLGQKEAKREARYKEKFANIPYLNSSLFEVSQIEQNYFLISSLRDDISLKIKPRTALKQSYKNKTQQNTLEYLLDFLDSYDFSNESSQLELIEESKDIINASVLGLIFEKINGYKDGSFYTPGFITEYMAQEVIKQAVLQKFKDAYAWDIQNLTELKNLIGKDNHKSEKITEYNNLINSITVCDPAVGSGHFLVSVLNEFISIKSQLNILADDTLADGTVSVMDNYSVFVENDILVIYKKTEDEEQLHYTRKNKTTHQIQQVIFKEKAKIIENCLFGVDINPNSVNICRLRLWIELLKHTYYHDDNTMAILPNIDINIKSGDSLISKYRPRIGISKHTGQGVKEYKDLVKKYKETSSKQIKHEIEARINKIKFEIAQAEQFELLDDSANKKINAESVYQNSLEWLIEFPEVLDDEGKFKGFDVIIGNPPYIQLQKNGGILADMYDPKITQFKTYKRTGDIYSLFYEQAVNLLAQKGVVSFITSNKWMRSNYGGVLRYYLTQSVTPLTLIDFGAGIFDSATVDTNILTFQKGKVRQPIKAIEIPKKKRKDILTKLDIYVDRFAIAMVQPKKDDIWSLIDADQYALKTKIEKLGKPLRDWDVEINYGIKTGYNEAFIIDTATKERLCKEDPNSAQIIKPLLRGKDIKSYVADWKGLWLINTHNGYEGHTKIDTEQDYPAIWEYLSQFKEKLKKRSDKGSHWSNLRDCAYLQDFAKNKLIYPDIESKLTFSLDKEKHLINNTAYFLTGNSLEYLAALLNSTPINWYYSLISAQLGNKGIRHFSVYIENIPVIPITPKNKPQATRLEDLAAAVTAAKKNTSAAEAENTPTVTTMLQEIDQIVYDLYGLTEDEIAIIEAGS